MTDIDPDDFTRVVIALSELKLCKPTLQLDAKSQALWARKLLLLYPVGSVLAAISQAEHSATEWVNLGTLSTESRRHIARTSTDYAPHRDASRLTSTQLRRIIGPAQKLPESKNRRITGAE